MIDTLNTGDNTKKPERRPALAPADLERMEKEEKENRENREKREKGRRGGVVSK
ncbi:MAG: hypothetical protein LBD04_08440 [Synergistaceae bacterium]|nr:hypothetical protein [Synergistaceae bacterium]